MNKIPTPKKIRDFIKRLTSEQRKAIQTRISDVVARYRRSQFKLIPGRRQQQALTAGMNSLAAELAKAFISLWGISSFIDDLAEIDHQASLSLNTQLAGAGAESLADARRNTRLSTLRRCELLRKKLGLPFLLLATAVIVALVFGVARLPQKPEYGISLQSLAGIVSIFSFAWATLGRLGWEGQSWKGTTVFERHDDFIFRALYWVGTYLGVFALFLPSP